MMRLERLVTPFAKSMPDQVAVDGTTESLTYAQLDALANRFAHVLKSTGIKPGERVGVHLPRSGRGIAAMLGALRAGATYVPLDPSSPAARLKLIANDCGLRHLVLSPSLLKNWLADAATDPVEHFVLTDASEPIEVPARARVHAWSDVMGASVEALPPTSDSADDLAYMLYTSGSTGTPKGVMLSHRNALAFVDWAADLVKLSPADRVSSVAPFHFDLSVFDIWSSLSRGSTIVIVDEVTVISGPRMVERIRSKAITVWYSVPTAIILMMETGNLAEGGAPSLRSVFFAGEVFPIKHLRRAMEILSGAKFHNLFGPTETNVCTAYTMPGIPSPEATAIPIGTASCGDEAMVLGEDGKPVADGEVGELFIEGPTVMLGYWNGGARTPAKHPYPTGDLVSKRPDGQLMYHGRRDHMVKIHGFRVELGEVEFAIHAHSGVREAIVLPHERELVAVVVPSDPSLSVLGLKRHCASRLPKYMVPFGVRLVKDLPRTSSGKVDRQRTAAAVRDDDKKILQPYEFSSVKGTP
jgi:amino acid adenylation domain-containing protein